MSICRYFKPWRQTVVLLVLLGCLSTALIGCGGPPPEVLQEIEELDKELQDLIDGFHDVIDKLPGTSGETLVAPMKMLEEQVNKTRAPELVADARLAHLRKMRDYAK